MRSKQFKILLVDDDPFVRAMLSDLMAEGDWKVETANDGVDALNKYRKNLDIDLILSDMNMPEMNGLELLQAVRKTGSEIPFIILTVNKEIALALEAIRCGANEYLLKDENIQDTIFFSVRKVMERHRLEKENIRLMQELEQKNRDLERLSFSDALTGIANRRYFDTVITQEWLRAKDENRPLSLIMIDIDYFKLFNDTYGHQEGDRCLQEVAKTLNSVLKKAGDFLCRYGGEEFIAVLPDTDLNDAIIVAKAMSAGLDALNISHICSQAADHVTVSIGIASSFNSNDNNVSDMIERVDRALYLAKREGRNRIKVVSE